MKRYPFLDLGIVNEQWRHELIDACSRVIDSGRYIGGDEVESFERELAAYCGCSRAVGVGNGTDALHLILRGYVELGIMKPGDEVIVPANTFIATALAVVDAGLVPVFVDADVNTYNIDVSQIENAISEHTRAVITVHLYGRPSYSLQLREVALHHNLKLIEDSAQAIGAGVGDTRCGALGDAAAFSFYPTKNLGALGDGGAVTTSDESLADVVLSLRQYGSCRRNEYAYCGVNSRLDPIQAAMLRVKMSHLNEENRLRRELALVYSRLICNPRVITPTECADYHVYHQYVVRVADRDAFRHYLAENGVETDVHYPIPPHLQPCFSEYGSLHLPVAEQLAAEVVSLPINPACLSTADAEAISKIINAYGCDDR